MLVKIVAKVLAEIPATTLVEIPQPEMEVATIVPEVVLNLVPGIAQRLAIPDVPQLAKLGAETIAVVPAKQRVLALVRAGVPEVAQEDVMIGVLYHVLMDAKVHARGDVHQDA